MEKLGTDVPNFKILGYICMNFYNININIQREMAFCNASVFQFNEKCFLSNFLKFLVVKYMINIILKLIKSTFSTKWNL